MTRKMLTDKEAKDMMPVAKGKKRKTEIEADHELEAKMDEAQTKKKRPQHELQHDPKAVKAGPLRGVMQETMARVYAEIWPGMETTDSKGNVDTEIREETYILALTMIVGNNEDKPRKVLKMREVEMGDDAPYCQEHAA